MKNRFRNRTFCRCHRIMIRRVIFLHILNKLRHIFHKILSGFFFGQVTAENELSSMHGIRHLVIIRPAVRNRQKYRIILCRINRCQCLNPFCMMSLLF